MQCVHAHYVQEKAYRLCQKIQQGEVLEVLMELSPFSQAAAPFLAKKVTHAALQSIEEFFYLQV